VKHRPGLRQRFVNRCVDAVAGTLDIAGAAPECAAARSMRACHSSTLQCKLFGETLICIGVSSVIPA
jgi:hypothetical protein